MFKHLLLEILNGLRSELIDSSVVYYEAPLVTDEQVLLFHSNKILETLKRFNDKGQRDQWRGSYKLDGDTEMMQFTLRAAYRAAGAIILAVDHMYSNRGENVEPAPDSLPKTVSPSVISDSETSNSVDFAFCCVRPPGHHATRAKSQGFCFLNNVGIAAKYAQKKYGVERIAVLDFDVHHGNGH